MESRNHHKLMIIGASLTKARIASGYAMSDVAAALGCNKGSVSRWEAGKLNPSDARIRKMVEMFGCSYFVVGGNKE